MMVRLRNSGAGVENYDLARPDHANGRGGDAEFFVAMQAFFFLERAVVQCSGAQRQSATVGALKLALAVQKLKILADGDQGSAKALRKAADENPALRLEQFEDVAPALFTQHKDWGSKTKFRFISN